MVNYKSMKSKTENLNISLHEPRFHGNELKYLTQCIKSTWVSTNGEFINRFEKEIQSFTKSKYALYCINGTHALQVSLLVAGVKEGDEVIVPTVTFIAPINAISYNNASPIFMDSDNYFNIDENKTIEFIKKNTSFKNGLTFNKRSKKIIRAIIIVHTFGNAAKVDELIKICKKRNIKIIEDASESLGTVYKKNKAHTGTLGDLGVISFNGNKIITSGAGAMILTNKKNLYKKLKYLIYQAKDDGYNFIHNEVGFNFAQTNLNAALGLAQLEKIKGILIKKRRLFAKYSAVINQTKNYNIYNVPHYSENNHWLNILKVKSEQKKIISKRMLEQKIQIRPIWQLNHLQKKYAKSEKYKIRNAIKLYKESICLPSSYHLTNDQFKKIIGLIY